MLSPLRTRLVVIALGVATGVFPMLVRSGNITEVRLVDVVVDGISWLLFYEISRAVKVGNRRIVSLIGLTGLIWIMEGPTIGAIYYLYPLAAGQTAFDPQGFVQVFSTWFQVLARYPSNLFNLIDAATLVGVSYCLSGGAAPRVWAKKTGFWQTGGFGNNGECAMEMSPAKSHTTRLLCASAFLAGSSFREMVLKFLEDPNRAAAPELGMDLALVAKVCKFARNRDRRYDWIFFSCAVLAAVGALVEPVLGILVLVLASAGTYFRKQWQERFRLVQPFAKHVFDPVQAESEFEAELEPEQFASLPSESQNLIVYQGFSPFVGAGISLGGWSFVVNVDKGKEDAGVELEPIKFHPGELYGEIDRSVESLGLTGLSHQDMYFVSGSDIRDDRTILPTSYGRPVQVIDPERAQSFQSANDRRIRHYKWIRVMDWGNELSSSYFLRCTVRGNNMFVEINRYLLTPLAHQYRQVDALAEESWQKGLGIAILALFVGPLKAAVSPLILLGRMQEYLEELLDKKHKERLKLIDENPLFNYGTGSSLREALSSGQFMHYFQKLDGDFYSKVLEREILAAIVDFLDAHDIDTSELKERQSTILNSGIIIHGGDVKAESLAVGTGAQAVHVSKPEPARKLRIRRETKGAA